MTAKAAPPASYIRRLLLVVSIFVVVGIATALFFQSMGLDPLDADAKYDWLVTRESLRDGGDAYSNLLDLAAKDGVSIKINTSPASDVITGHPRTPGALLVQFPIVWVPFESLFAVVAALTVFCVGGIVAYSTKGRSAAISVVIGLILAISAPSLISIRFGGQSALVAALVIYALLARRKHPTFSAILIGLAAVLKVFPMILIIPWIFNRRYKESMALVASFTIVNAAGLLLPGVSAMRAIQELSVASSTWIGLVSNGSLARLFHDLGAPSSWNFFAVALVAVAGAIALLKRPLTYQRSYAWLALGLLLIPLSWISYDIILFPAILALILRKDSKTELVGLMMIGLWIIPTVVYPWVIISSGSLSLAVRVGVVLLGVVSAQVTQPEQLPKPNQAVRPSRMADATVYLTKRQTEQLP